MRAAKWSPAGCCTGLSPNEQSYTSACINSINTEAISRVEQPAVKIQETFVANSKVQANSLKILPASY